MAMDDYMESEVAVAVAVTAVVMSPRARNVLRKGAVYGLAGVLKAADAVGSFARGVGRGAGQGATRGETNNVTAAAPTNAANERVSSSTATASESADKTKTVPRAAQTDTPSRGRRASPRKEGSVGE